MLEDDVKMGQRIMDAGHESIKYGRKIKNNAEKRLEKEDNKN